MVDFYNVLGVSKHASKEEIKKAYRKVVKECHPDLHTNSTENIREDAARKFKAVSEAYETLSSHSARSKYDSFKREARHGASTSYSHPGSTDWANIKNPYPRATHIRYNFFTGFVDHIRRHQTSADTRLQLGMVLTVIASIYMFDSVCNSMWQSRNQGKSFQDLEAAANARRARHMKHNDTRANEASEAGHAESVTRPNDAAVQAVEGHSPSAYQPPVQTYSHAQEMMHLTSNSRSSDAG